LTRRSPAARSPRAATLVVVPVVLLFFFTQRYFIQGVTLTGIKG
jgi:multiple sugar transport system permease protein